MGGDLRAEHVVFGPSTAPNGPWYSPRLSKRVIFVGHDRDQIAEAVGLLEANGFPTKWCANADEALAELGVAGVVIVDAAEAEGFSAVAAAPTTELVLTGDPGRAAEALVRQDIDYLANPSDASTVLMRVRHALRHRDINVELATLRSEASKAGRFGGIVGTSAPMLNLYELINRAASTHASILITGESGTGKELVARELHRQSDRASQPFVAINCSAMPEALLESELFGHVRGAFTDAKRDRKGLFLQAQGGTIFLDEIGDMPLALQPRLLRALQERKIRPVGADEEVPVDVRIISATNADLEDLIENKSFREDLYYRLNVVNLTVPPLRERISDILPLAEHFLHYFAVALNRRIISLSQTASDALLAYHWPGNVRELQNCIESAVTLACDETLEIADLPVKVRNHRKYAPAIEVSEADELVSLEELERRYIVQVLTELDGNKKAAAKTLGIDRKTLYRKLEMYDLSEVAKLVS